MSTRAHVASAEFGFRPLRESGADLTKSVFPYFTDRRQFEAPTNQARSRNEPLGQTAVGEFARPSEAEQMYESLLDEGLSQIAYPARDILEIGYVRPETKRRVVNELVGTALDRLGKPFKSEFSYQLDENNRLVAENGESVVAINERGLKRAQNETRTNPSLKFRERRFEADVAFIEQLENMAVNPDVPVGTTLAAASACPDSQDVGVSNAVLKRLEYQPDVDMAVIWMGRKTESGITFTTINLFHATPDSLAQTIAKVTGQTPPFRDRESTPWYHVKFLDQKGDAATQIPPAFDALQRRGEPTIHGLTYAEAGSNLTAEKFIDTADFQNTLQASEDRLTEAAESIVSGQMLIPSEYLDAILKLRKPNGEFELELEKRAAVLNVLSSIYTDQDFITSLKAVHTAVSASLWAKISQLYHNDGQLNNFDASDSLMNSIQGLAYILDQRMSGRVPIGCSGGGVLGGISIFDLKPDQLASVLFGGRDEKGSLIFTCDNGHPNVRSSGTTNPTCTTCGCSVRCED